MTRKEYIKEYTKTHQKERKEYREQHSDKIKDQQKIWYLNNRTEILNQRKEYNSKNSEKIKTYQEEYRDNHKIEHAEYSKQYNNKKRKYDVGFRVLNNLRNRIWKSLNGINKSKRTIKLIGCSIKKLKKHLENKFADNISWDNYGAGCNGKGKVEWHIDHIKPCASFDLSKPEEQSKCFHYSNLQPLWAADNLHKSAKII